MKKAPTVSLLLTLPFYLFSQLQITGTGTFNADLSGFTGSGFHPTPASDQLDSDTWRVTGFSDGDGTFGGTHTTGDFARGSHSGGVTTGGVYKFGGRLGVQPTGGDFTPGTITLRIQNVSGSPITEFQINYTVSSYNDQNRANSLNFQHSGDDAAYTSIPALNYTSVQAAAGSPMWDDQTRSATISGINIPNNGFYYLQWTGDDVSGSGFRDEFGISAISISNVVLLPIQLSGFEATPRRSDVALTWQTQTEINNAWFTVQHSRDGSVFSDLEKIPGGGTSLEVRSYSYLHTNPAPGINYYRLKQTDFDGAFSFSPVLAIDFKGKTTPRLYPMPASNSLYLELDNQSETGHHIYLFNMNGTMLRQHYRQPGSATDMLDVSTLASGPYFLKIKSDGQVETLWFVKK